MYPRDDLQARTADVAKIYKVAQSSVEHATSLELLLKENEAAKAQTDSAPALMEELKEVPEFRCV